MSVSAMRLYNVQSDQEVATKVFCAIPARAGFNAGLCAVGAYMFSAVNPVAAALFGAVSSISRNSLRGCIHSPSDNLLVRNIKITAIYVASAAASSWCMNTVGLPIAFNATVGFTGLMWVTSCIITPLALGCICCTWLVALLYGSTQLAGNAVENEKNKKV